MEMLEEQYQELLDQKGQKSKLDQEIAELRQEIKEILNSVEKQSFRYGNQKVNFSGLHRLYRLRLCLFYW